MFINCIYVYYLCSCRWDIETFSLNIGAFSTDIGVFWADIWAFWADIRAFSGDIGVFFADIWAFSVDIGASEVHIYPFKFWNMQMSQFCQHLPPSGIRMSISIAQVFKLIDRSRRQFSKLFILKNGLCGILDGLSGNGKQLSHWKLQKKFWQVRKKLSQV